jgi:hypothetical protein
MFPYRISPVEVREYSALGFGNLSYRGLFDCYGRKERRDKLFS